MFTRLRIFNRLTTLSALRPTNLARFCSSVAQNGSEMGEYWLYPDNFDSISEKTKQSCDQGTFCIWITDECIERVNHLKTQNSDYKYLKIQVDSGGCSGFSYDIKMCDSIDPSDIVFLKDDVTLLVDEITLDMIKGSKIHYKEEMIRAAFEVVENPNASLSCSCGTSFAPKSVGDIF